MKTGIKSREKPTDRLVKTRNQNYNAGMKSKDHPAASARNNFYPRKSVCMSEYPWETGATPV